MTGFLPDFQAPTQLGWEEEAPKLQLTQIAVYFGSSESVCEIWVASVAEFERKLANPQDYPIIKDEGSDAQSGIATAHVTDWEIVTGEDTLVSTKPRKNPWVEELAAIGYFVFLVALGVIVGLHWDLFQCR